MIIIQKLKAQIHPATKKKKKHLRALSDQEGRCRMLRGIPTKSFSKFQKLMGFRLLMRFCAILNNRFQQNV